MEPNIYFISGINTDAGKSYCTAWYAKRLSLNRQCIVTQKFIQAEDTGHPKDTDLYRRITGAGYLSEDKEGLTMPEILSYPYPPHFVARIDNRPIDFKKIERSIQELARHYDTVFIEGVGGSMVPLTERYLTIDCIAEEKYPLIFITSDKLSSISHTLLNLEAIKHRGIPLNTILYSLYPTAGDKTIQNDTMQYVQKYLSKRFPRTKFGAVPEINNLY